MAAKVNDKPLNRRIIRRRQLQEKTNLSKSTIYGKMRFNPRRPADYDATFPLPIPLGARAVGWDEGEVDAWLEQQAAKRLGGTTHHAVA